MELQPKTMKRRPLLLQLLLLCDSEREVQADVAGKASDLEVHVHSKPKPQTYQTQTSDLGWAWTDLVVPIWAELESIRWFRSSVLLEPIFSFSLTDLQFSDLG